MSKSVNVIDHFSYRELMLKSSIRLFSEVHLQGTKQVVRIMHDSSLLTCSNSYKFN